MSLNYIDPFELVAFADGLELGWLEQTKQPSKADFSLRKKEEKSDI